MDSFEDLGLKPELVEALAAEGIERPTPLQESALPVVRRGNNALLSAGPGAGSLVAYGAGLLDRLDPEVDGLQALVVVPFAEAARQLATCLGRLALTTGHSVAAVGSPWARTEEAQILFCAPGDLLERIVRSAVPLESVQALIVDGMATILSVAGREALETILEAVPDAAQKVLVSLPLSSDVVDIAERHVRRAVTIPPRPVTNADTRVPNRGSVFFRVVGEPKEDATLSLVAELTTSEDTHHVILYVRSEDRAADLADWMSLHGYSAGEAGDEDAQVWLAVDEVGALPYVDGVEGLASVSVDVPSGPDALDRRHGSGRGGHVLVLPRELAHLKDVAARTGYRTVASPSVSEVEATDGLVQTLELVEEALKGEDVDAYLRVLEPLLQKYDPAELAAAALALLRKKSGTAERPTRSGRPAPTPAWARLYMSLGHRDEAGPGDIVGAITGEARIEGSRVGRIDINDTFSVVEVDAEVAEKVIASLNGVTLKGRSLRVDYDRGGRNERANRAGQAGARSAARERGGSRRRDRA